MLSGERGGRSGEAVVAPPPSTIMGGGLCRLGLAPGDTDEPAKQNGILKQSRAQKNLAKPHQPG